MVIYKNIPQLSTEIKKKKNNLGEKQNAKL